MHGKKKVERSAEENEKRNKKLVAYQQAMKIIFHKRSIGEWDDELMQVVAQVLVANPDISTLWNIRKETSLSRQFTRQQNKS